MYERGTGSDAGEIKYPGMKKLRRKMNSKNLILGGYLK